MDIKETLEYIDGAKWFGAEPGLERINQLLDKLDRPEKNLKFVHIAGTNGKGSCAAMTASILRCAGYKTGLFTSPYLVKFNERMQINGQMIEDDELCDLVSLVKSKADTMDEHPTEFEIITATAFMWFSGRHCDIVVLEVGLGGRFDATNVIGTPLCAGIMNIGLDHTEILGDSLEKIAGEKAGIIKPHGTVVAYEQSRSVMDVIKNKCLETDSALIVPDFSSLHNEFDSIEGQVFSYKDKQYAIPLLGANQLKNAATVIEIAQCLRDKGYLIDDDAIEHGIYAVNWPCRFEVVNYDPIFIIDGGHNPQCAQSVSQNIKEYCAGRHIVMIVGMLKDKDWESSMEIINAVADEYIAVTPDSPRALSAETLGEKLSSFGKSVSVCDSLSQAAALGAEKAGADGVVCAFGSMYMAGKLRETVCK